MMLHRPSRYTVALALLALPALAGAQAFGLNEIGSCALARGFAVTSAPCTDASNIYWNPGAMPARSGLTASGGVAIIKIDGDFTRDTSFRTYKAQVPTAYVPHLFLNYGSGKMAYGLGVYVPYGLTSQWGDDFPGRFSAVKASLQTVYVQPNLAYQINDNWSVGGGPVIGHSTVELIQALELSGTSTPTAGVTFGNLGVPKYTEFGRARLKGSAMAYGVNVGVHGRFSPEWEFGARFLSQLSFSYDDADATFTQSNTGIALAFGNPLGAPAGTKLDDLLAPQFAASGPLVAQKVSTQIRHPAQAQAGFTYSGYRNTLLSADFAYVGWKSFGALPVNFQGAAKANSKVLVEDYNNTSSIRLGLQHKMDEGFLFRLGFAAATSAAPPETVTALLPEQDRELGTVGIFLPISGAFGLDAAYAHIFTPGARGRIDERSATMTSAQALALNSGAYTLNANILSLTFKYNY